MLFVRRNGVPYTINYKRRRGLFNPFCEITCLADFEYQLDVFGFIGENATPYGAPVFFVSFLTSPAGDSPESCGSWACRPTSSAAGCAEEANPYRSVASYAARLSNIRRK